MDRDFADAIINFALWRDPERVGAVIADVTCQLEAEGYSAGEIAAAIDEGSLATARQSPFQSRRISPPSGQDRSTS